MDVTDFPYPLVKTQAAWNATYEALAAPRPRDTTALRRRLLFLSVRLWWHPYWETVPCVDGALRAAAAGPRQAGRPGGVTARLSRPGARGCAYLLC